LVAGLLTGCEVVLLLALAILELLALDSERLVLGLTTASFFVLYGAALAACAVALVRERRWSRGPLVLAQLIQLGVAWSFAQGETVAVAVLLAVAALTVLVVLFLPSTTAALLDDPD
jgi:hypothetical protein